MEIYVDIKPEDIKQVILADIEKEIEWYMDKFNVWDDEEINKMISKTVKKELKKQIKEKKKSIEELVSDALTEHTKDIALEILHSKSI
jgi:hypothetical protein